MTEETAALEQAGASAGETKAPPPVQRRLDLAVQKTLLWVVPAWVRPNHLTIARFALIPVILVLLHLDLQWWAFGLFLLASCTDFVDGAMARTRGQITMFGTYMDPVADKLLVAAVLAWVGYRYLVVQIILAFIVLELVFTALGVRILLRTQSSQPSNAFGKFKMMVQTAAVLLFLVSRILDLETWVDVSVYLLWLALALGAISGAKQIYDLRRRVRSA